MVEGGMKCVKYLLFLFNLIFVLAGIGLVAAGAYVKIKLDQYYDFFGNDYMGPGILLIVVGVFIFILAFFGCCGAYKENYCLTMTFAVFLGIIFILEISGGIAAFVLRDDIESEIEQVLSDAQKNYNTTGHDGVTSAWDKLQEEFDCCGVQNFSDWKSVLPNKPPASCCKEDVTDDQCSGRSYTNTVPIYTEGCRASFEKYLKDKVAIIGGVGIGLAFVQVVGILFACCLARAIRKEYEVV
ncbi:tetraspanin [Plakobranchus ocellatus]|uniref:Tetraspanin n=1 Tax=Plakobranchus ocellatus TaxID=259542 RepID=A0AAV4AH75_9GAST|nr:tetraspanin [Plakobranchus ocellatus]